jgi:hypothetical protein
MTGLARSVGLLLLLSACAGESSAPSAAPLAAEAPVPAAAPAPSAAPSAPGPCATPGPRTFQLQAGTVQDTPWDLKLAYGLDDDRKLGPGYMFLLRSGEARWETRRDKSNWRKQLTWRGYCWRGGALPGPRATHVEVEVAPVCKDGVQQMLGGCADALSGS